MLIEMRLVAVQSEVQGRVRAVYDDDPAFGGDGEPGEYVVISGEKVYLADQ